jgi:hypothetical protein
MWEGKIPSEECMFSCMLTIKWYASCTDLIRRENSITIFLFSYLKGEESCNPARKKLKKALIPFSLDFNDPFLCVPFGEFVLHDVFVVQERI